MPGIFDNFMGYRDVPQGLLGPLAQVPEVQAAMSQGPNRETISNLLAWAVSNPNIDLRSGLGDIFRWARDHPGGMWPPGGNPPGGGPPPGGNNPPGGSQPPPGGMPNPQTPNPNGIGHIPQSSYAGTLPYGMITGGAMPGSPHLPWGLAPQDIRARMAQQNNLAMRIIPNVDPRQLVGSSGSGSGSNFPGFGDED